MALPDSPPAPEPMRAPRKIRPPRWLLVVVGAFALLVAAGWWSQRPLARIALPDGGELILVNAQYGLAFHYSEPIGLGERLRHYFSSQRRNPLWRPSIVTHRDPTDLPRHWLLFELRKSDAEKPWLIVTESGRELDNPQTGNYSIGIHHYILVELKCFPQRARQLDFRIYTEKRQEQPFAVTIPNPYPKSDAPRWTPEPVPQTRKLPSREIVLASLGARSPALSFNIDPVIEVHEPGVAPRAFKIDYDLSDATGNFGFTHLPWSEPAWKIHATVTRTGFYPFPPADYLSLGHTTMPGPGEARVLTLPADPRVDAAGGYAVFVGPGRHRLRFGGTPTVEPVPSPEDDPGGSSAPGLAADGSQVFLSYGNMVVILGQGLYRKETADCPHRMRAMIGTTFIPFTGWGWGTDFNQIPREDYVLDPSAAPPPGTEMELQLLLAPVDSVDFFVHPPQ